MSNFHKEDKTGWQIRNRTLCHGLSLNLRLSVFLSMDLLLLKPMGEGKAARLHLSASWPWTLFETLLCFLTNALFCGSLLFVEGEEVRVWGCWHHSQQPGCTNGLNCRDPQAKFHPDPPPLWSKGIERITYIDGPMRHRHLLVQA